MRNKRRSNDHSQRGVALLIAIFVLLLISVVAIALLVSSGTETALGANYRSSSTVYYAALAGLEEARGRLLPKNPDPLVPGVLTPGALPIGFPIYITNPSAGETVDPTDSTNPYYDSEYLKEFPTSDFSNAHSVNSVWHGSAVPGPLYKWVRITAATEFSINADVDYDQAPNNTSTPLFYDPANIATGGTAWPSLIVNAGPPSTAVQALEITALAYLPNGTPNGSKKILQYVVAPITTNIPLPGALTLDGYSDAYSGPQHSFFQILGADQSSLGGNPCPSSGPLPGPSVVPAIAVPDFPDVALVINGNIPPGPPPPPYGIDPSAEGHNYSGTTTGSNVVNVSMPAGLQTVEQLDQLVQSVTQNADLVITGPANQTSLPSTMSAGAPMVIAVSGDFTLGAGVTGYGLLLVTGNFVYDPASNWNGVILVIGQGKVTAIAGGTGGLFSGAMLIAKTRNPGGNLLAGPNPGTATFDDYTNTQTNGVGRGIFYNRACIELARQTLTYKVLSFHEIPQ